MICGGATGRDASEGESRFYASDDGLRLHCLDFAPPGAEATPVVCLPGLTRPAADFGSLGRALAFASATPRRVVAFDYRGRGLSDHDPDASHYDLAMERADILRGLALLGIESAHVIGTSRGGLHIMAMAATNRSVIRGAVLNDIGPVIEAQGLKRIKSYVGRMVAPATMDEAIALLKLGGGEGFEGLSEPEWRIFAETTFGRDPSDLRLRYDPALARTLDTFDLDKPLPDNWRQFDALRGAPVLTIRGANSDILSQSTLAAMAARWPQSETLVVPGQAHAPLLADAATIGRIDRFLAAADASAPPP